MVILSVVCIVLFLINCFLFYLTNFWCKQSNHWQTIAEQRERDILLETVGEEECNGATSNGAYYLFKRSIHVENE